MFTTHLEQWCGLALDGVMRLPQAQTHLYRDVETLSHFHRVADELLFRTGRFELVQAGFLHGLQTDVLPALREIPHVLPPPVEQLLLDRQRLRDIAPTLFANADDSKHQHRRLMHSVMARISTSAAVVLLIVEQLDHLDPTGEGREWLRSVYQEPVIVGAAPRLSFHPGRVEREHHLAFAESVIPFLCSYFGFAEERRFARDLVALHRDRHAAERVVAALVEHQRRARAACEILEEELKHLGGQMLDVRWEWRHIRSCQVELGSDVAQWPQRVWGCGFATVVTREREDAYRILARLHEYAPAEHSAFRDYFSPHRNQSPYRALHTGIYLSVGHAEMLLRVRIVPLDSDQGRYNDGMRDVARRNPLLFDLAPPDNSIVVYTPAYDVKYLPTGALVLNFAAALYSRWVACVESATVNDEPVDAFARLKNRDTVRLTLRDDPAFLPLGWWKSAPDSTQRSLRESYVAAVGPLVLDAGRRSIREALDKANQLGTADHEIDTLVERAVAIERARGVLSRRYTARDCLRQLGLSYLRERAAALDIPGRLTLTDDRCRQLLDDITHAALPAPELDIPADLRRRITTIVPCPICEAQGDAPVVGVERDGVLTIHVPDCEEAAGGTPLGVQHRLARRLYVAIETSNRPGLLADVCNLLRRRHIDVVEVAGRSFSPHWAAVRIELDCQDGTFMKRLLRDLQTISGVHRVLGPDDPPDALIERDLPPRRDGTLVIFGTNPIVRNAPVTRDDQFYGRDRELREFKSRVMRLTTRDSSPQFGELLVLLGALQVGKTSFLLRSLREMHRERTVLMVEVYLESRQDEPWSVVEDRLLRALRDKVAILARLWKRTPLSLDGLDLTESARAVIEWTDGGAFVIAIDEVLRLIDATSPIDEECERMCATLLALRATPRCMVVLSGPAARVRPIHPSLEELVGKCQRIELAPFGENDIKRLIVADKLPWTEKSAADPRVVARVLDLTRGDPLWVGCLIHQLWESILHGGRTRQARFTDPGEVDRAAQRLMADDMCFEVRLRFLRSEAAAPYRLEAFPLLDLLARNQRGPRTVEDLASETGLAIPVAGARLRLLEHAGVARAQERDGILHYEIASPILAAYLSTPREGQRPIHREQ
jgi:(p)ppGpp synthase/HD superfamily hydrolase/DNA-binding transcriptional ArsR family regulator